MGLQRLHTRRKIACNWCYITIFFCCMQHWVVGNMCSYIIQVAKNNFSIIDMSCPNVLVHKRVTTSLSIKM